MRKHSYKYGLVLLTTVATLCSAQAGRESEKIKPVLLTDLPSVAQQALVQQAQGASMVRLTKNPVFYLFELTLDGEQKGFWVKEDALASEGPGKINKSGREYPQTVVQWSELPLAVQQLVGTKYQGKPLGEIRRSIVSYTAVLDHNGTKSIVRVTEQGKILPKRSEIQQRADEDLAVRVQVQADQEKERANQEWVNLQAQQPADRDPVAREQMRADGHKTVLEAAPRERSPRE